MYTPVASAPVGAAPVAAAPAPTVPAESAAARRPESGPSAAVAESKTEQLNVTQTYPLLVPSRH